MRFHAYCSQCQAMPLRASKNAINEWAQAHATHRGHAEVRTYKGTKLLATHWPRPLAKPDAIHYGSK